MSKPRTAHLDIDLEPAKQEVEIMESLLREYRTLDAQIQLHERWAHGDGLLVEPSMTVRPPSEDDMWVLAELTSQVLSEGQERIVEVAKKYVQGRIASSMNGAAKGTRDSRYVTKLRLSVRVRSVSAESAEEQELLEQFAEMLSESAGELWTDLTEPERYAIMREIPIQRARQKLTTLQVHKNAMDPAMETLKEYYFESYRLLWEQFVLGKRVTDVREILGEEFSFNRPLTRMEHIDRRKKAFGALRRHLPYLILA